MTSHGFAMNITPEPIKWFDLVLACGLADVHAVALHDLLERSSATSGVLPPSLPSVKGVAEGLVPRFERAYGRQVIPLGNGAEGEGGGVGEVEELREVIWSAEKEARRLVEQMGGWTREPYSAGG
jgi:lipoyl(octanoyl) transferase